MISVIVPVYKVEKYLDKCVQSIVDQTYHDLEIILVDDGSPDNCPAMCDAWAEKDARIRVIHKENGGLSDARNAGMAAATGEYIGFVDSDDWLADDFYMVLLSALEQEQADIAACGVVLIGETQESFAGEKYTEKVFSPEQALRTIQNGDGFHAVAWNKLYKRPLFQDIAYPVNKLNEDEFVTYRVMDRAKKLVLCQEAIYYYRQREDSIMASWDARYIDVLEAFLDRLLLFKSKYPNLYVREYAGYCTTCVVFYRKLLTVGGEKEDFAKIKAYRRLAPGSFKAWWAMNMKQKVYVLCSKISLSLFAKGLNCRGTLDD